MAPRQMAGAEARVGALEQVALVEALPRPVKAMLVALAVMVLRVGAAVAVERGAAVAQMEALRAMVALASTGSRLELSMLAAAAVGFPLVRVIRALRVLVARAGERQAARLFLVQAMQAPLIRAAAEEA